MISRMYMWSLFCCFFIIVGCDELAVTKKNSWRLDCENARKKPEEFLNHSNYLVRSIAVEEIREPQKLEKMAEDKSWYVRKKVVENIFVTPQILEKLANDSSLHVRRAITKNLKTSEKTLRFLATDPKWQVRFSLVENENVPMSVLYKWSESESHFVKKEFFYMLSQNPKNFIALVDFLNNKEESDSSVKICEQIASYGSTNEKILQFLTTHPEWEVRLQVAKNPNTQIQCLQALAKDNDETVRSEVVNNEKTPTFVLETMTEDEDEDVQEEVMDMLEKRKSEN